MFSRITLGTAKYNEMAKTTFYLPLTQRPRNTNTYFLFLGITDIRDNRAYFSLHKNIPRLKILKCKTGIKISK
jgi:hypothetical protein